MIDAILLDLRHSIRTFAKNPSFISVIVLTLAIGIGANTAMFSVIEGVLLRPLPLQDSGRLISLWTTMQGDRSSTGYPDFREIRDHNHSFTSIAAYTRRPINVTGKQDPERLRALVVSPEFLSVLGVQPRLGRDFVDKEGEPGTPATVIISYNMWKSSFAGDSGVLGRDINLDRVPHTIIGVLPPDFWFLDLTDQLIVPLNVSPGSNNRSNHFLNMIARLRPGVSREVAASELRGIANSIAQKTEANKGISFALASLQDEVVGNVRPAIVVLMIAVGFVLLIACGNLASLLLARSVARRKEIAVRTALGATPGILVRQFLTESIFLALLGGIAGILCSSFITGVVHSAGPGLLPRASQIHIDPAVLLFALMTSLLTGAAFGVGPVFHASKGNVSVALKGSGSASSEETGQYRLRAGLVVSEIALALVLLAGAGLMIKSLHILRGVDSGFRDENVLIFNVNLPQDQYLNPELIKDYPFPGATAKANALLQQATDRVAEIPGVRAVGATSTLPLSGVSWDKVVTFYDRPLPSTVEKLPPIEYRPVVGDYFRALGVRLIGGRVFTERDNFDSPLVAVVNQELVRRYMNGVSPIGKQLSVNPPIALLPPATAQSDYPREQQKFTIIGVVGDARYTSLQLPAGPMVYVPYSQNAEGNLSMWFAVHTASDPRSLVPAVRREMAQLDVNLPLGPMNTMADVVSTQIGRPRIETFVLAAFGALALLLATLGVYGVMSYSVARRTREIGIRMALGARLVDIMRIVMRQGSILIALGLVIGFGGTLVLTQFMKSMLYGIRSSDPQVLVATCALLVLTALGATYFPAHRAARVDPQSALRNE